MIGPLSLEATASPKLNKHCPMDLHWRKEPPFWQGNLENALIQTYPTLCEQVLCFQCGAIPCPYEHDDDTRKKERLVDLEFVKEMAKERREFKQQMQKLSDRVAYLERLREESARNRLLLENEVTRLRALNVHNKDMMDDLRKDAFKLKMLEQTCASLHEDVSRLEAELSFCRRIMNEQVSQIETLNTTNTDMSSKLVASETKVQQLVIQIDESKLELEKAQNNVRVKDEKMYKMETELRELLEELAARREEFHLREMQSDNLILELRNYLQSLQDTVARGQDEQDKLVRTIVLLRAEIEMLKKKLASDTRFQQFVDIKRDYNSLKYASGTLAHKVQLYESQVPLPSVSKSGKIVRKKSSVIGLGTRPPSALLNRPKSAANVIRPSTANSSCSVGNIADFEDCHGESRPDTAFSYRTLERTNSGGAIDSGAAFSERLTCLTRQNRAQSALTRSPSALTRSPSALTRSPSALTRPSSSLAYTRSLIAKDTATQTMSEQTVPYSQTHDGQKNPSDSYSIHETEDAHTAQLINATPYREPASHAHPVSSSWALEDGGGQGGTVTEDSDTLSDLSFADLDMDVTID